VPALSPYPAPARSRTIRPNTLLTNRPGASVESSLASATASSTATAAGRSSRWRVSKQGHPEQRPVHRGHPGHGPVLGVIAD
jgi:hypothetical protein